MTSEKDNYFWFFFRKIGKNVEKGENDENGSDIDEKGQHWWKNAKIIFFRFLQKNMENF